MWSLEKKNVVLYCTHYTMCILSGKEWSRKENGLVSTEDYHAAYLATENTFLVSTRDANMYKTTDAGTVALCDASFEVGFQVAATVACVFSFGAWLLLCFSCWAGFTLPRCHPPSAVMSEIVTFTVKLLVTM